MTQSITITLIDSKQNPEIESLTMEYLKRIHWKIKINVIAASKNSDIKLAQKAEGEKIQEKISKNDHVILLTEYGKLYDSPSFKGFIEEIIDSPRNIHFVIGGAFGLSDDMQALYQTKLSLSTLTFPHKIAKLLLIEQIYRSYMMIGGRSYHY